MTTLVLILWWGMPVVIEGYAAKQVCLHDGREIVKESPDVVEKFYCYSNIN